MYGMGMRLRSVRRRRGAALRGFAVPVRRFIVKQFRRRFQVPGNHAQRGRGTRPIPFKPRGHIFNRKGSVLDGPNRIKGLACGQHVLFHYSSSVSSGLR